MVIYPLTNGTDRFTHTGHAPPHPSNTNNRAEWFALGFAIKNLAVELATSPESPTTLTIYGDSQLVCNQLNGTWQCRNEYMAKCRDRCIELLKGIKWKTQWIPREQNSETDALGRQEYFILTGKQMPKRR